MWYQNALKLPAEAVRADSSGSFYLHLALNPCAEAEEIDTDRIGIKFAWKSVNLHRSHITPWDLVSSVNATVEQLEMDP